MDDIDLETFAYERSESDHMRGGLDWKLLHAWIPPAERLAGQLDTDAYPTPTMIGEIRSIGYNGNTIPDAFVYKYRYALVLE